MGLSKQTRGLSTRPGEQIRGTMRIKSKEVYVLLMGGRIFFFLHNSKKSLKFDMIRDLLSLAVSVLTY